LVLWKYKQDQQTKEGGRRPKLTKLELIKVISKQIPMKLRKWLENTFKTYILTRKQRRNAQVMDKFLDPHGLAKLNKEYTKL
jgi:hypothetical protein